MSKNATNPFRWQDGFDDLAAIRNGEFRHVMRRLSHDRQIISFLIRFYFGKLPFISRKLREFALGRYLRKILLPLKKIEDFQHKVAIEKIVSRIVDKTTDGFSYDCRDKSINGCGNLYISNHRDIVLDTSLINYALDKLGFDLTYYLFGDNLQMSRQITNLFRINGGFVIKRDLAVGRNQIQEMAKVSAYIEHLLMEEKRSVWLAQSNGRAKDGNDITNPAVIKMLSLAGRGKGLNAKEYFSSFSLVPTAISYEFDPVDRLKAWQNQRAATRNITTKRKNEDILAIIHGIKGDKGRVHVGIGEKITPQDNVNAMAQELTEKIVDLYRLWPSNYIAYDQLNGGGTFAANYSEAEQQRFCRRFNGLPPDVARQAMMMYSNAVKNKIKYGFLTLPKKV